MAEKLNFGIVGACTRGQSFKTALDAVGAAFEQVFAETGCRLRLKREATYADAALLKGVGHSSRTYTGVCALFV